MTENDILHTILINAGIFSELKKWQNVGVDYSSIEYLKKRSIYELKIAHFFIEMIS